MGVTELILTLIFKIFIF